MHAVDNGCAVLVWRARSLRDLGCRRRGAEEALSVRWVWSSSRSWLADRRSFSGVGKSVQQEAASHSFPSHAGARAHGPSWAPLFEHPKRIQQLEADFTTGRISEGIVLCDEIVADLLDGVATTAGIARSDSAVLAPWLGVSGPRWLTFRRIVRRARDGGPLDIRDGLYVYAVLLELRLALQS